MFSYNVVSLLVGGSSPYSPGFESIATKTVEGVQSANVSLTYPRIDTYSWDGNGDQEMVDRPRAELSFDYGFASGLNETYLGFSTSRSGTISALNGLVTSERNYYLLVNLANQDSIGYSGFDSRVLALGNGVVNRYDFSAQVGQPTTASVTVEGLNLLIQPSGSGQPLPALHKQTGSAVTGVYTLPFPTQQVGSYFEAAPGSIVLTFNTGCAMGVVLSGQNACPVESFGFSIDLARNQVKDMGWAYPEVRPINWPVTIGIRANAYLNAFQLDALNRYGCPDSGHIFTVGFKDTCSSLQDLTLQFNGAKLDTETVAIQVGGGSARVSFNWTLKVYDINRIGPANPNFYINTSGTAYSSIVFPQVDYVSGQSPLTFDLNTPCYLSILSGPGLLDGDEVYVTDEISTVVVRAEAVDGSDTQDVTVTIS